MSAFLLDHQGKGQADRPAKPAPRHHNTIFPLELVRMTIPLFEPFQERPEHGDGETSDEYEGEPREQQPAKVGPI